MAASITLAGESLIAQKQAAGLPLKVSRFILANVPGLNVSAPVNRAGLKPPVAQIVYSEKVTQDGFVNPNQVVYSLMMGTDIGDFDFNWIGLETADNVLLAVAYIPLQQKRKNILPGQIGNNVTRNFLVVFDGAQQLTGITIDASTWQFDYTARMKGIDERERLSNRDIFGRACFFGTGLQLEKVGAAYRLKAGLAYVEGIRLERAAVTPVTVPVVPNKAWLDVVLQRELSDVVGTFQVVFGTGKVDYLDNVGARHYLVPLADLPNASTVTDLRKVEAIDSELVAHFAARTGDYPKLRARGTTKEDVKLDQIPNAISDDAASNSGAVLATTKMVTAVRALLQLAIDAIISGASIAGKAAKLATARTISLTGNATGSGSFDGSANLSIAVTVDPAKHTHSIAHTTGLQAELDAKLPLTGGLVTGITGFFKGVHGGYASGNGGSNDWGACIWGIGPVYSGAGANAEYTTKGHYGLSWIRGTHPDATAQLGEGVYIYSNGGVIGGIGSAGIYTAGTYYGNGAGITHLNASNLASGTLPDARLSGTYNGVNISGNAGTANKWTTPRSLTFTGGATGTGNLDGSGNVSIALTVPPSAHTHTIAQVTGLNAELIAAAPPGLIGAFATLAVPAGWLKCNGAAISRTAYAQLFAVLGTHYGAGNGSTTFNLPDARGEFIRGLDEGRGINPNRVLGSIELSQNLSHTHAATVAAAGTHTHPVTGTATSAGEHTHTAPRAQNNNVGGGSPNFTTANLLNGTTAATNSAGEHTHPVTGTAASSGAHVHPTTIAAEGGTEARPRSIAFAVCIKY